MLGNGGVGCKEKMEKKSYQGKSESKLPRHSLVLSGSAEDSFGVGHCECVLFFSSSTQQPVEAKMFYHSRIGKNTKHSYTFGGHSRHVETPLQC